MPPGGPSLHGPLPVRSPPPRAPEGAPIRYETAPPDRPGIRRLFYGLFAGILAGLVGGMAVFVIQWSHPASVVLFVVLSALFVGAAYGLARQVIALVARRSDLPSLAALEGHPRVAILYATMNDVVEECLRAIQPTYPSDVFVLDDSSAPAARALVDRVSAERGYTVLRRPERRGFKAGAINDWYARWGAQYDYFVLLDADSFLPTDWVGEALKYAEHPANASVAVFQGLINIWNLDTRFVQTLAPMTRVGQFVWEAQLANSLDAVFCYGHNVLIRRSAVDTIGGFVEGYVSEDFATAVALAGRGWHSRFVPLHTYEAMPENLRGFIKRQNKWTRGAMEFVGFSRRSNLGPGRKLHLWQTPWSHFTNLLLPLGMILTVYGFASTPAAALAFLRNFATSPFATFWSVAIFRFLLVVGVLTLVPTILVYRRCGIGLGTYWRHRWLTAAVSAISLPYEAFCMVAYLRGAKGPVPVTPKSESALGIREILAIARYALALEALLLVGSVLFNPVATIFNATWLVPMLFAPAVVLRFSGPPTPGEGPQAMANRAGASTVREPGERKVHTSLSWVRATGSLPAEAIGADG
jgi:cellulose synthase/poly-beta-1,6-N-acetylglucosamine synthase-like glycosyltransferase